MTLLTYQTLRWYIWTWTQLLPWVDRELYVDSWKTVLAGWRWRTHAVKQTTESRRSTVLHCPGSACWHKGSTRIGFHRCNRLSNMQQRVNCRVASQRSLFSKMNPAVFFGCPPRKGGDHRHKNTCVKSSSATFQMTQRMQFNLPVGQPNVLVRLFFNHFLHYSEHKKKNL